MDKFINELGLEYLLSLFKDNMYTKQLVEQMLDKAMLGVTVTKVGDNVSLSNNILNYRDSYITQIVPDTDYLVIDVNVKMGNEDITNTAYYTDGYVYIDKVYDNVTITIQTILVSILKSTPFYIETLADGNSVSFTNDIEYSIDDCETWQTLSANTSSPQFNDKIYFRGSLTPTAFNDDNLTGGIGTFSTSNTCKVGGNIMSLLYSNNFENQTDLSSYPSAFHKLFYGDTYIEDIINLILPATTLSEYCYSYMFSNCSGLKYGLNVLSADSLAGCTGCYQYMFANCPNLVKIPDLPATTLTSYCYQYMFYNDSNLINAPRILPAMNAVNYCYQLMFRNTGIITAPQLPATTVGTNSYYAMFMECSDLINVPEILPCTSLSGSCYAFMFRNCTSITKTPSLPALTIGTQSYYYMFNGCISLKTITDFPATKVSNDSFGYMFANCTSLIETPVFNFNEVEYYCCRNMFHNCTSLVTAHELTATYPTSGNIPLGCYQSMFENCTSLINITLELPINYIREQCYWGMFKNCSSLTYMPIIRATSMNGSNAMREMFYGCSKLVTTTPLSGIATISGGGLIMYLMFRYCTSLVVAPDMPTAPSMANSGTQACGYMFADCTNLVTPPSILPATTIKNNAYEYMFSNCTSLTTAPELPATTLTSKCYQYMFNGCTSLTSTPELPATTCGQYSYDGMFYGCTSLTTINKIHATSFYTYTCRKMFAYCTSITQAGEMTVNSVSGTGPLQELYYSCTSLTDASLLKLNSSTTCIYCYYYMFYNCTSLINAPELPALNVAHVAYNSLFNGCRSLNYIKALFCTESSSSGGFAYATNSYCKNVASSGIFVKNINATWTGADVNLRPASWTLLYFDPDTEKYYLSDKTTECDDHGNIVL